MSDDGAGPFILSSFAGFSAWRLQRAPRTSWRVLRTAAQNGCKCKRWLQKQLCNSFPELAIAGLVRCSVFRRNFSTEWPGPEQQKTDRIVHGRTDNFLRGLGRSMQLGRIDDFRAGSSPCRVCTSCARPEAYNTPVFRKTKRVPQRSAKRKEEGTYFIVA